MYKYGNYRLKIIEQNAEKPLKTLGLWAFLCYNVYSKYQQK
jgi:hypothetical protein